MSTRNIEKLLHPGTFNWVGNAFYTTSFIGKGNISHRRMDPFFAIGYNADIDFEFPNTYNTAFLVINGDILVNGTENKT